MLPDPYRPDGLTPQQWNDRRLAVGLPGATRPPPIGAASSTLGWRIAGWVLRSIVELGGIALRLIGASLRFGLMMLITRQQRRHRGRAG